LGFAENGRKSRKNLLFPRIIYLFPSDSPHHWSAACERGRSILKTVTWIHTADLHLDEPLKGWKGTREEGWRRMEEYRETFRRIIDLAEEKRVTFLFIAGDFLEYGAVSKSTVRFVQNQLNRIPSTAVFIAPGNHDPCRPDSAYALESWPEHVHIFKGEWEAVPFPDWNVTIVGRAFTDLEERNWIAPPPVSGEERKILVLHGDLVNPGETSPYFPVPRDELANLEAAYVALGHIHKPREERLDNGSGTLVCYPGSPEALNWKETGERTVVLGTMEGREVRIERISVQTRAYEKVAVDVAGCETREEVLKAIFAGTAALNRDCYLTLTLAGRRRPTLDLEAGTRAWLADELKKAGFHAVWLEDATKPDWDLDYFRKQPGIAGMFVRRMEERMKQEPERKEELERALYIGLEALLAREKVLV
jgi:DNA repair exonuclease SbcCD nuclease subunit